MQKLALFVCLLVPIFAICQNNFPGKDVELLSDRKLIINVPADRILPDVFFKDENLKKKISKYSTLISKEFFVANIDKTSEDDIYAIKINNPEIGDIYIKYNTQFEFMFPFDVVGGLTWPEGYQCKNIQKSIDKFNGETTYESPETDGITLMKIIKNGDTSVLLMQSQYGSTANVGKKGLYILLKNNKRIDKPDAQISVKVSHGGDGFIYTVAAVMDENDIKLLSENEITDTRVYVYDRTVSDGKKLMDYFKCLINK